MKKLLSLLMAAMLALSLAACAPAAQEEAPAVEPEQPTAAVETPEPAPVEPTAPAFADGVYLGSATGFNGEIEVAVTVAEGKLTSVEVVEHTESAGVSDDVILGMPVRIVEEQTYATDAMTGATFTANGIKNAVADALKEAPAGMFDTVADVEQQDTELSCDLVVVGAGMAGMVAAIDATEKGLDVILLEKLGRVGGSAVTSGGIVYATNSPLNAANEDSPEAMADYWQSRAEGTADYDMLLYAAQNSGASIQWLIDNGVVFADATTAAGTSPVLRAHNCTTGGAGVISALKATAEELGIKILRETPAKELIYESGVVTGVIASSREGKVTISAKNVLLATGGFDASAEMKALYTPDHVDSFCMSSCGNTGDAITMGAAVDAAMKFPGGVIGFRGIQPALPYTNPINMLMWSPTLGVDETGARYQNETSDYPIYYANMLATGGDVTYSIFDGTMADAIEGLVAAGYAAKGATVEELASAAGFDPAVFAETFARYNELAATGTDEDFGSAAIAGLGEGPYYAVRIQKATIGSFGGLVIDTDARVLSEDGAPIAGLYAAGECANGQFFFRQYPASGTMLGLCTTFARAAVNNIIG